MSEPRTRPFPVAGLRVPWWVLLVVGVLWLVFGMVVLQFDLTSAKSIALAAGLLLVVTAFGQLVTAQAVPRWRWVHALLAALFFVGGMIALVWPEPTFHVLARLVAWFLFFKGCADLVVGLAIRAEDVAERTRERATAESHGETAKASTEGSTERSTERSRERTAERTAEKTLWWVYLQIAAVEIGLAFWAAGSASRSAALLMLWIGLFAVVKGITDIVLAFGARSPERAPA